MFRVEEPKIGSSLLLMLALLPAAFPLDVPEQYEELNCWSKEDLLKALDRYRTQLENVRDQLSQTTTSQPKRPKVRRYNQLFVSDESSTTEEPFPTCNICNAQPCFNGGICQVDLTNPWHKWICQCPGNYTGSNCETPVICEANTCGANAVCSVSNHQTNCVCKQGFSGNAQTGCSLKTKNACISGDPHYTTFDRLYFDYQGTCPVVFSQPCSGLAGGYDNFSVFHKNERS